MANPIATPRDWMAAIIAPEPADPAADNILAAALRCFERRGLRRTTVEEVARAAKVSRITIYRRYPNKPELVSAVFVREARRALLEITAAVSPIAQLGDRFVEMFVVTLRVARAHPLLSRMLASEPEAILPYLSMKSGPTLALARGLLAAQIRGAQEAEIMRAFDADVVAELLVRMIWSFLIAPESVIDLADDAKARAFVKRFLFSPLRVPRSHPP